MFAAPILKLFEVGTELLTPFLIRYIIDDGIAKGNWGLTFSLIAIILAMAVLGFLVTMVAQYLSSRVAADYGYVLKKEIYKKTNSVSERQLNEFGRERALTLINHDSFAIQGGVNMFMRLIFRPPFLMLGSFLLSFLIDWRAGLIFAGVVILSAAIFFLVISVSPKKYSQIQSNLDDIAISGHDAITGARSIRAFDKSDAEKERFSLKTAKYQKSNVGMAVYNALISPGTFFLVNLGMILVVYLGNLSDSGTSLTTGEIVSLIAYLVSTLQALLMFSRLIVSLNKALASQKRVDSFLALEPEIENGNRLVEEGTPASLVFENVSFRYGKDGDNALESVSFSVKPGETLGIIGGTGSGKSTLASLIMRLKDPLSGTIAYKGVSLKEYDLGSLRSDIAFVSQKPGVFKGTIRSNLLLGKKEATDEELWEALEKAAAKEYVSAFEGKLDHEVLENGSNLSGGQKQRLLLARALLKDASLIILDDSTSALDYLSEKVVLDNVRETKATVILISQRAGTIKRADKILVMNEGHLIASGTHESLISECEVYKETFELQKGVSA